MKNKHLYNLYVKMFPNNSKTSMTEYLMKQNKKNLVGAELGVKYGGNAFSMLKHLDIKKLYLIDHYDKYIENEQEMDFGYAFPIAKKKLKRYKNKIVFIKKDVNDTFLDIKEPLDFVWMDASGEYDTVYNFLKNYFPLMNSGGLIGGKRFNSNWFPLCRAVFDFVDRYDLDLVGSCTGDWWVVKK